MHENSKGLLVQHVIMYRKTKTCAENIFCSHDLCMENVFCAWKTSFMRRNTTNLAPNCKNSRKLALCDQKSGTKTVKCDPISTFCRQNVSRRHLGSHFVLFGSHFTVFVPDFRSQRYLLVCRGGVFQS